MRVLIQHARRNPRDWEAVDSTDWGRLPARPLPSVVGGQDDEPGWVMRLNVQGVSFVGYDHYAVEPLPDRACRVTVWKDDPDDLPTDALGEFYARVWTFLPLAPDARIGGRYNTRQSQVVYAGPRLTRFYEDNPTENTVVRSWGEFAPPPDAVVRHGVWVPDELMSAHDAALSHRGWREWTDGVPARLVRGGRVVG